MDDIDERAASANALLSPELKKIRSRRLSDNSLKTKHYEYIGAECALGYADIPDTGGFN